MKVIDRLIWWMMRKRLATIGPMMCKMSPEASIMLGVKLLQEAGGHRPDLLFKSAEALGAKITSEEVSVH